MFMQTWFLPISILITTTVLAFPLSRYLAWIMDGRYKPAGMFRWFEAKVDSGPQDWKQYTASLIIFKSYSIFLGETDRLSAPGRGDGVFCGVR